MWTKAGLEDLFHASRPAFGYCNMLNDKELALQEPVP
jgi:hypothetical protein